MPLVSFLHHKDKAKIEASQIRKDFSALSVKAKTCPPPAETESGTIFGGFARNQVLALADKVVDAVKSGAIKRNDSYFLAVIALKLKDGSG